jgi:hypothetical protein
LIRPSHGITSAAKEAFMRDDPYPARYYGRQFDEPFADKMAAAITYDTADPALFPFQQPLARVLLILMTFYFACALFLIFTVSSYAAPLGNGTMSSPLAAECVETATIAAR